MANVTITANTELQRLVEELRAAQFHLSNMISIAAEKAFDEMESVMHSARGYSNEAHRIWEELEKIADAQAAKGGRVMAKTTPSEQQRNVAIGDGIGLSMDANRARRFASAMARIHRAVHSLDMAATMFPNYGAEDGHMEPIITVRTFAKALDEDIQLIYRMIENEEAPELEAAQ